MTSGLLANRLSSRASSTICKQAHHPWTKRGSLFKKQQSTVGRPRILRSRCLHNLQTAGTPLVKNSRDCWPWLSHKAASYLQAKYGYMSALTAPPCRQTAAAQQADRRARCREKRAGGTNAGRNSEAHAPACTWRAQQHRQVGCTAAQEVDSCPALAAAAAQRSAPAHRGSPARGSTRRRTRHALSARSCPAPAPT